MIANVAGGKHPHSRLAQLSLRSYFVLAVIVGLCAVVVGAFLTVRSDKTYVTTLCAQISSAVGTSVLAALLVQWLYGLMAEQALAQAVAVEASNAAEEQTKTFLYERFARVVPIKSYARSQEPTEEFRADIEKLLRTSRSYRHKGSAAGFAGFRLQMLKNHQAIKDLDQIVFCILDPREQGLLEQQAWLKLTNAGERAFTREDLSRETDQLREEAFITLVTLYDIAHERPTTVYLHTENLFFRSEIFDDGLFISYYLGGEYPGTYLYENSTFVWKAFLVNFQNVVRYSGTERCMEFRRQTDEAVFMQWIAELGCTADLPTLRSKRDALHATYRASVPFALNNLF
jgi:hypothetical protein